MKTSIPLQKCLPGLALVVCTNIGFAAELPSTVIGFDPDGSAPANSVLSTGSLDWAPSSILITNVGDSPAIPLAPDTTTPVQFSAHARLAAINDENGTKYDSVDGLGSTFEITIVAASGVNATVTATGTAAAFDHHPEAPYINYFRMYYDDFSAGSPADAGAGTGYADGTLILSGRVVEQAGVYAILSLDPATYETFDQSPNGNQWGPTQTVVGVGSQDLDVLVDFAKPEFFPDGLDSGSLVRFKNSQVTPFREADPSMLFTLGADASSTVVPNLGPINGISGPDMALQIDPNQSFTGLEAESACRVTAGGVATSGIIENGAGWDGTTAEGEVRSARGAGALFRYQFGGQAGANTALQPQPKGEWTHHQQQGPANLRFSFHAGTASAPPGTEIDEIICTDPGFCFPARPAPNKQIDFVGIGTFSNIRNNGGGAIDGVHTFPGLMDVVAEPRGNGKKATAQATYHWFQVHMEDLGEPGNRAEDGAFCPAEGSGNDPFSLLPVTDRVAECDCADFYRITIYEGFVPVLDADGNITNPEAINKTDMIYQVYSYLDGGNIQIHPLTGFDLR